MQSVDVRQELIVLPTYRPAPPDRNPMFLEKRVYQGSSGKVYPLPFIDRIAEEPVDRNWKAIWIENEYLQVLVLPELGGRIHRVLDKTNGYDVIYYQEVIKPALVGLTGPWISGGIEFNWPQHHRPATFMPVDTEVEHHDDGSVTVWCSDHDPMCRMKGMHGVCLHPERATLELKVRAYNRTPFVQTFLWWANVCTRVHEAYQSFFPPDVSSVADHARRSMSSYPLADGHYYGVDYGERGRTGVPDNEAPRQFVPGSGDVSYPPHDLSFYANIPVPTSYMCVGSKGDFFGGYDYNEKAGIIHVANHHISPGKKQWTWGNHEFGYAWDRNLADALPNGECPPYIEIMAGVYTDNQPDFSFLQPGETKTWSQHWYPIQQIGAAHQANLDAAVRLTLSDDRIEIGVAVTRPVRGAVVRLERTDDSAALEWDVDLAPDHPFVTDSLQAEQPWRVGECRLRVLDADGNELIHYRPEERIERDVPPPATEPPAPADIPSADELFLTGLHLEQYRHATRSPAPYWEEALRRDPLDSRCNNALGLWRLRRGEFDAAETHFRQAIERLTRRNGNPYDGEAFYNLGLTLRNLGRDDEAYDAFYKACWNQGWMAAGYHALAEIDGCRGDWGTALEHATRSLQCNTDNLRVRNLKVIALRELGRGAEADDLLQATRALDPLDWWARLLAGEELACDGATRLDLAHDLARMGRLGEAVTLLEGVAVIAGDLPDQNWGVRPMVRYTLGWLEQQRGDPAAAGNHFAAAATLSPDYCFPSRLEDILILEVAIAARPEDARAPYYLGNLLYDRRRHEEAIQLWQQAADKEPDFPVVWRNLGIGYFNVAHDPERARAAYDAAFRANAGDARLVYERDQLWKRLGEAPTTRRSELETCLNLVAQRDDTTIEYCALCNQTGEHEKALALVRARTFQPWEGGEGGPLGQWVRSHVMLGRAQLDGGDAAGAREHFEAALTAPWNLGEAKHLLANQSDIHYWLGCALSELGESELAATHWRAAAEFKGDFQEMSMRAFSEMTYYSARAWHQLGAPDRAEALLRELLAYAEELATAPAGIDYFATSLPTMLLFDVDPQQVQETTALFLQAQARLGLGETERAQALIARVLERDPSHALAADLA